MIEINGVKNETEDNLDTRSLYKQQLLKPLNKVGKAMHVSQDIEMMGKLRAMEMVNDFLQAKETKCQFQFLRTATKKKKKRNTVNGFFKVTVHLRVIPVPADWRRAVHQFINIFPFLKTLDESFIYNTKKVVSVAVRVPNNSFLTRKTHPKLYESCSLVTIIHLT